MFRLTLALLLLALLAPSAHALEVLTGPGTINGDTLTVTLDDQGKISIAGSDSADDINLVSNGTLLEITSNGEVEGYVAMGGYVRTEIAIDGGGGDDTLTYDLRQGECLHPITWGKRTFDGGDGADTLEIIDQANTTHTFTGADGVFFNAVVALIKYKDLPD